MGKTVVISNTFLLEAKEWKVDIKGFQSQKGKVELNMVLRRRNRRGKSSKVLICCLGPCSGKSELREQRPRFTRCLNSYETSYQSDYDLEALRR